MDCSTCKTLCSGCKYKIVLDAIIAEKTKKAKLELLQQFLDKENTADDKTL